MHAVLVVAHPDRSSLTHAVAEQVAGGVSASGARHSIEIVDLAEEGFDPRFNEADVRRGLSRRTSGYGVGHRARDI